MLTSSSQVIVDGLADGTGANGDVPNIVSSAREMRSQMPWHIIVDTNETDLKIDSDRPLPAAPSYSPTPSAADDPFAMHTPMPMATPPASHHSPTTPEVFDVNLIFYDPKPQTVKVGKGALLPPPFPQSLPYISHLLPSYPQVPF